MTPEPAAIERQLEAIVASAEFVSAPKIRALLRYLVEATLAGDQDRLKGYAIGVDVFERGEDFDPGADPIVRVQAGRLRKLLEAYYHTAGRNDPIRLEIPKGAYTVEFTDGAVTAEADLGEDEVDLGTDVPRAGSLPAAVHHHLQGPLGLPAAAAATALLLAFVVIRSQPDRLAPAAPAPVATEPTTQRDGITLAVLPFTNMSKEVSNTGFGDGLADALTTALSRVKSVALAPRTSAFQYRSAIDLRKVGRELGVRYVIEGGLQQEEGKRRLNVQLVDTLTGAHVWAQEYDLPGGDILAVQREIVTTLAAELRPQLFNAYKLSMVARPAQPATAWQLYMQSTWMPGEARNSLAWEKERVALAKRAIEADPNLGQAHSVLADKLAYLANVDPPSDTEELRAEAALHARRATDLAPNDADALFNVSVHHWHAGRIKEALEATRRTLDLDPNHVLARFLLKALPYTCAKAPQSTIDELSEFDAKLSPDNPVRWVTLTWISALYLNNADIAHALDAARRTDQIFRTPDTVYRLAAILVQAGDRKAAVAAVDQQRGTWPNLDPHHYADVTIPRRCGDAESAAFLHGVYRKMADAFEGPRRGG